MIDMASTTLAKVDQLTADALLGGDLTITVTKVSVNPRDEQPATLSFEGDNGMPYKPCKSMRRVLVQVWGPDASAYVGRSMVLFRDDAVQFGGLQVGGIRIRAMSHMEKRRQLALTARRGQKAAYIVEPLRQASAPTSAAKEDNATKAARALIQRINDADDASVLEAITGEETVMKQRAWLREKRPELAAEVDEALRAALDALPQDGDQTPPDDDFPGDRPMEDAA